MTHSLEVSQISQGLARILRVNEDLAQTIALSHDLGHSPFGHSGEHALNRLMKADGGFEHNVQSYRVVTELEERYPNFKGLNLSYEVLEGIVKHTTDYDDPHKVPGFKDVGFPTIEAQIVNYADQIAYMNHDLDDGLHWGMLTMDSLESVPLWGETFLEVKRESPDAPDRILRCRTISLLIGKLITDLQAESGKRIRERGIKSIADVRERGDRLVSFSDDMEKKTGEAKRFLFDNVYRHNKVIQMSDMGAQTISDLFTAYSSDLSLLPEKFRRRVEEKGSKRHICDYIAGMTDRFAIAEHKRLCRRN